MGWRDKASEIAEQYSTERHGKRALALAALVASTGAFVAGEAKTTEFALAQVNPPNTTPQIGPPTGSPNIFSVPLYCYTPAAATGAGALCNGPLKMAVYQVSCTMVSTSNCVAAAAVTMGPTFSQAPWCTSGQASPGIGAATLTTVVHNFNAGFTTDTPAFQLSASVSQTILVTNFCIGD